MLPGTLESHWMTSTPSTAYRPLDSDLDVDVLVIGGGIAGLSTAWEVSRTGRSVAVVEADRIAAGVTGYTTAKLTAQHTLVYAHLREARGAAGAEAYAKSQSAALERVAEVAGLLGVDCELERRPAYTWVESDERVDEVLAEVEAAREAGLDASFTTTIGPAFQVAGAIRVENQAQFHPRKYLLALADDLTAGGGRIFERTRAVELHEDSKRCRVGTEHGHTITAQHVVVATHYPVFDRALLFTRLTVRRELVVAATIPADLDPGGLFITPEQNTRSVRTAPYGDSGRLLIVTGEHFTPGDGGVEARWQRLVDWTMAQFPDANIVQRWATQDTSSSDRIPFIGPLHVGARNAWVATGFGGWGMTSGVMSGQMLAAQIAGEQVPWASLYDPRRVHPVEEAPTVAKLTASVARHFVGGRLASSHVDSVDEIPPGDGAVLRVNGERCAVHRDADGNLHAVSARCTHLGCLVHFNRAEVAWECPCHGSRFGVDGSVIEGPATAALEKRSLDRK